MEKTTLYDILVLQAVVAVYTVSGVISKFAARASAEGELLGFLLLYGAEIAVLGIYAILWQQMIKKFELSVAYANRGAALLWALLWSVLIFGETLSTQKLAGVAFVILGTVIVNGGKEKEDAV